MEEDHEMTYIDYTCSEDDHSFVKRYVKKDGEWQLSLFRVRVLGKNGEKLYLKENLKEGFSEIWKDGDKKRVKLNNTIKFDFTKTNDLARKIAAYLIFA